MAHDLQQGGGEGEVGGLGRGEGQEGEREGKGCPCQALVGSRYMFLLTQQQKYCNACVKLHSDRQTDTQKDAKELH